MTSRRPERLDPEAERQLLRRLAGEPGTGEPAAGPAAGRLAALWEGLEPPPAAPAPPGFTGRVMARVRDEAASPGRRLLGLGLNSALARAAGAAALVAGIVVGAGLGRLAVGPRAGDPALATSGARAADPAAAESVDELAGAWSESLAGGAPAGGEGLADGYAEAIETIGAAEGDR